MFRYGGGGGGRGYEGEFEREFDRPPPPSRPSHGRTINHSFETKFYK